MVGTPPPPPVPHIPGYRDLAPLGRGGYSEVYRAYQERFDRWVAVKVLTFALTDERSQRRFLQECQVAGRLSAHPNIVTVYDADLAPDGRPYISMELFDRGSIGDRLARGGAFDVADALRIAVALAGALETAHRAGVVHRDVKPANALLAAYGQPALTDFGLSILAERHELSVGVDALTPYHAAPEGLERTAVGAASDVYSLASTTYAMLAGRAPHQQAGSGESMASLLLRILQVDVPPIARPDIPASLDAVLRSGLSRDAATRTPSALAFADGLQQAQRELGLEVASPVVFDVGPGTAPATPPTIAGVASPAAGPAPGMGPGLPAGAAPATAAGMPPGVGFAPGAPPAAGGRLGAGAGAAAAAPAGGPGGGMRTRSAGGTSIGTPPGDATVDRSHLPPVTPTPGDARPFPTPAGAAGDAVGAGGGAPAWHGGGVGAAQGTRSSGPSIPPPAPRWGDAAGGAGSSGEGGAGRVPPAWGGGGAPLDGDMTVHRSQLRAERPAPLATPPKKRSPWKVALAVLGAFVLVGGIAGGSILLLGDDDEPADEAEEAGTGDTTGTTIDALELPVPSRLVATESDAGVTLDWEGDEGMSYSILVLSEADLPTATTAEGTTKLIESTALRPDVGYCYAVARVDALNAAPEGREREVFSSPACIRGASYDTIRLE